MGLEPGKDLVGGFDTTALLGLERERQVFGLFDSFHQGGPFLTFCLGLGVSSLAVQSLLLDGGKRGSENTALEDGLGRGWFGGFDKSRGGSKRGVG